MCVPVPLVNDLRCRRWLAALHLAKVSDGHLNPIPSSCPVLSGGLLATTMGLITAISVASENVRPSLPSCTLILNRVHAARGTNPKGMMRKNGSVHNFTVRKDLRDAVICTRVEPV